MQQEIEILDEILERIDDDILATKKGISKLALEWLYILINISIKAIIFNYLDNKQCPYDKDGNISISTFDEEVDALIQFACDDLDAVMAKYGIKRFKGSISCVGKFMTRHHLVFRKCHLERRGAIKDDGVDEFLSKVSDVLVTHDPKYILNMDQTYINTYNQPKKQIDRKSQSIVKIVRNHVNTIEGYNLSVNVIDGSTIKITFFHNC